MQDLLTKHSTKNIRDEFLSNFAKIHNLPFDIHKFPSCLDQYIIKKPHNNIYFTKFYARKHVHISAIVLTPNNRFEAGRKLLPGELTERYRLGQLTFDDKFLLSTNTKVLQTISTINEDDQKFVRDASTELFEFLQTVRALNVELKLDIDLIKFLRFLHWWYHVLHTPIIDAKIEQPQIHDSVKTTFEQVYNSFYNDDSKRYIKFITTTTQETKDYIFDRYIKKDSNSVNVVTYKNQYCIYEFKTLKYLNTYRRNMLKECSDMISDIIKNVINQLHKSIEKQPRQNKITDSIPQNIFKAILLCIDQEKVEKIIETIADIEILDVLHTGGYNNEHYNRKYYLDANYQYLSNYFKLIFTNLFNFVSEIRFKNIELICLPIAIRHSSANVTKIHLGQFQPFEDACSSFGNIQSILIKQKNRRTKYNDLISNVDKSVEIKSPIIKYIEPKVVPTPKKTTKIPIDVIFDNYYELM
jgi:hypothetical protein